MDEHQDSKPRFVADGAQRLRDTEAHREAVVAIEAEVRAEFSDRARDARPLTRLWLALACRREIARRKRALAPPGALYLSKER